VLLDVKELVAVLAAALCHLHGEVRIPEQLRAIAGLGALLGHADAHGDDQARPTNDKRRPQHLQDPLGDDDRGRAGVVFQDRNCELVAAQTGDQVVRPGAAFEADAHLGEQHVGSVVTDGEVDVLEVVDVDGEDVLLGAPAGARAEGRGEPLHQGRTIHQSGDLVVGGPTQERHVTAGEGSGHAVERLGQLAQLVVASHVDAMVVVASLNAQDALPHAGDRQAPGRGPPAGGSTR